MLRNLVIIVGMALAFSLAASAQTTSQPAGDRPRVVCDSALLQALHTDPQRARHLELLEAAGKALMEQAKALPEARRLGSNTPFDPWMAKITTISLRAVVSNDPAALDEARAWLKEAIQAPADVNGNYEFGAFVQGLATAYDLLAPRLDAPLRDAARNPLEKATRTLYHACAGDKPGWWHGLYLHHDLWIPTAGLGVGAAVLRGVVPEADTWYAFAKAEFEKVFSFVGDDGGWTEGPAPWCYGVAAMVAFVDAVERVEGKGFGERPWLASTARYRLYALQRSTLPLRYVLVDDSHDDGRYGNRGSAAAPLLWWLAGRYGDSQAQWLAGKEMEEDLKEFTDRKSPKQDVGTMAFTASFGALWFNPAVAARQPQQGVSSVLFRNIGLLAARAGWTDNDEVLTFQCGPLGGHIGADHVAAHPGDILRESISHVHANANSITYYVAGRPWIVGPGYGYRDTGFQNTVAIEGGSQVWAMQPGPKILRQEMETDHVYVLGDATGAWPKETKMNRSWRHMLWLPGTGVFLCDQLIVTNGDARNIRRYDWQFHHPANVNATRKGASYRLSAQADRPGLAVDVFTNGNPRYDASSLAMPNGYVRLKREALVLPGEVPTHCWIAAAIHMEQPQPSGIQAPDQAPVSATLSATGPGWTGLALVRGVEATVVIFALDEKAMLDSMAKENGLCVKVGGHVEEVHAWVVGLSPNGSLHVAASIEHGQVGFAVVRNIAPEMHVSPAGVLHLVAKAGGRGD